MRATQWVPACNCVVINLPAVALVSSRQRFAFIFSVHVSNRDWPVVVEAAASSVGLSIVNVFVCTFGTLLLRPMKSFSALVHQHQPLTMHPFIWPTDRPFFLSFSSSQWIIYSSCIIIRRQWNSGMVFSVFGRLLLLLSFFLLLSVCPSIHFWAFHFPPTTITSIFLSLSVCVLLRRLFRQSSTTISTTTGMLVNINCLVEKELQQQKLRCEWVCMCAHGKRQIESEAKQCN